MSSVANIGFSTDRLGALWSAASLVRRMLEVEVALARAGAACGVVPRDAVARIEAAASELVADPTALLAEGFRIGTPVAPLVTLLRTRAGSDAAPYVHLGATSQDVVDTAMVLQLRASFVAMRDDLVAVADGLHQLLSAHPEAQVAGRTLLQVAVPMRWSFRVARWLETVLAMLDAIDAQCASLPIQLGGPVGDLESFGSAAEATASAFARALGLQVPRLPWHTDRTVVVRAVEVATATAQGCATVSYNLALLSQPEIAEVSFGDNSGISSSMAHKRNPHHAVRAVAAARACHGVASIVTQAPPHELERAMGSWQAEWFALPLVMQTAAASVEATHAALSACSLDSWRAAENRQGQAVSGELSAKLVARVVTRYRALRRTAGTAGHG